jgi:hypothetical protein
MGTEPTTHGIPLIALCQTVQTKIGTETVTVIVTMIGDGMMKRETLHIPHMDNPQSQPPLSIWHTIRIHHLSILIDKHWCHKAETNMILVFHHTNPVCLRRKVQLTIPILLELSENKASAVQQSSLWFVFF